MNYWFGDHGSVSCCQLYIPALCVTHIQFPHEKTFDSIAALMLFTLNINLNLRSHASIYKSVLLLLYINKKNDQ